MAKTRTANVRGMIGVFFAASIGLTVAAWLFLFALPLAFTAAIAIILG